MASILIVDDDAHVSTAIGAFFDRAGHRVRLAATGEEALESFRESRPDLVLLDMRLPDIDGFDVLARMSEQNAVVIMFTAHGDIELAVRAIREGAENFLTNPIDVAQPGDAADHELDNARI